MILPQPGPQTRFLACPADIAIYGGAAGGGKTWALLMEAARHVDKPGWDAVTFRRSTPQLFVPGGLWDGSNRIYPRIGGRANLNRLSWRWPSGARVRFWHLEQPDSMFDWQGAQVPLIQFDELTQFTESQFWYLWSRVRSMHGFPGRMRATTNPDCDSWVAKLVEWYIGDDGTPAPERAGRIRWMVRSGDELIWADSPSELERYGVPISFSFVPARLEDNPALIGADPAYRSRLAMLCYVDRMRLLHGNWRIRATAGTLFKRHWFPIVDAVPASTAAVRYWDRAATKPSRRNPNPDWTVGLRMRATADGRYYVDDVVRLRDSPFTIHRAILNTARRDGPEVTQVFEREPGSSGAGECDVLIRMLAGLPARAVSVRLDKIARARPASAQAEAGNIALLRAPWNDILLYELEGFPGGLHDDQVDALAGALSELAAPEFVLGGLRL